MWHELTQFANARRTELAGAGLEVAAGHPAHPDNLLAQLQQKFATKDHPTTLFTFAKPLEENGTVRVLIAAGVARRAAVGGFEVSTENADIVAHVKSELPNG